MFGPKDIQWVRNVTRDKGHNWAYMEGEISDNFTLHWSKRYKDEKEAMKPLIGDLILLTQKPLGYGRSQLTHLVTPVSNKFKDCSEENPLFPWGREVKVIARLRENSLPKLDFSKVNQTHSYEISNLAKKDLNISEVQDIIWKSFEGSFTSNLNVDPDSVPTNEEQDESYGELEGKEKTVLKLHMIRERSSSLVKEKKQKADTLKCECCKFDFQHNYGAHGKGFIECHHRIPIHQGERVTTLEDLALVCANCIRMLHRKYGDDYPSIGRLKELLKNRGNA